MSVPTKLRVSGTGSHRTVFTTTRIVLSMVIGVNDGDCCTLGETLPWLRRKRLSRFVEFGKSHGLLGLLLIVSQANCLFPQRRSAALFAVVSADHSDGMHPPYKVIICG